MRLVSVLVLLMLFAPGVALAQQGPSEEPIGNLAMIMRGIFFPNSNRLFDVQTVDPAAPPPETGGDNASSRFASIYKGWETVEYAAVALADGAKLAMIPGRLCENGEPVPVQSADFIEGARLLEEAGLKVLDAARQQDQELVSELTNDVAGACSHCHAVYRDVRGGNAERCK